LFNICFLAYEREYWAMSQPYFGPSVGVKPNTPKVGNLESSGTPECLELDKKAQNTLHWGVLGHWKGLET
jgi:hypothetical protein